MAVLIVLGIRPAVGAMVERLLLRPEHAVLGMLAWGPVDYAIFYRQFMIIVTEAKAIYPDDAWGQHTMQLAGARDMLACQVERWRYQHNAGRKRRFWEMSELNDMSTNGISSNGNYWILTLHPQQG
ncbi:g6018 [Coccomyxa elongata]